MDSAAFYSALNRYVVVIYDNSWLFFGLCFASVIGALELIYTDRIAIGAAWLFLLGCNVGLFASRRMAQSMVPK
jgi:hypothetical protein